MKEKKYSEWQMILYPIFYIGVFLLALIFIFRDFNFSINRNIASKEISLSIMPKSFDALNRLDLQGYNFSSPSDVLTFNANITNDEITSYNDVMLAAKIIPKSCLISKVDGNSYVSFDYALTGMFSSNSYDEKALLYWQVSAYDKSTGQILETFSVENKENNHVTIQVGEKDVLDNIIIVFSATPSTNNGETNFAKYLLDVTNSNAKIALLKLSDLLND